MKTTFYLYTLLILSLTFNLPAQDTDTGILVDRNNGFNNFSFRNAQNLRQNLITALEVADSIFDLGNYRQAAKNYHQINANEQSPDWEITLREGACYVAMGRLNKAYKIYSAYSDEVVPLIQEEISIAFNYPDKNRLRMERLERVLAYKKLLPMDNSVSPPIPLTYESNFYTGIEYLNEQGKLYKAGIYLSAHSKYPDSLINVNGELEQYVIYKLDNQFNDNLVADHSVAFFPANDSTDYVYFVSERYKDGDNFDNVRKLNTENRSVLKLYQAEIGKEDQHGSRPNKMYFMKADTVENLKYNPAGAMVFTNQGKTMLFTRNLFQNKHGLRKYIPNNRDLFRGEIDRAVNAREYISEINPLALFTSFQVNDTLWSIPQLISFEYDSLLGPNFNLLESLTANSEVLYSLGHPCLNQAGNLLLFSSNIPVADETLDGGTYIYYSSWQPDKNLWSQPKMLENLVTEVSNNLYPFLHEMENDQTQLYFSSNKKNGIGGLDIYRVPVNIMDLTSTDGSLYQDHNLMASTNKFLSDNVLGPTYALTVMSDNIVNLGDEINSRLDDFGLVMHPSGGYGYFSSDKARSQVGDDNIYKFYVNKPVNITVVSENARCDCPEDVPQEIEIPYFSSTVTDKKDTIFRGSDIFLGRVGHKYDVTVGVENFYTEPVTTSYTVKGNDANTLKIRMDKPALDMLTIQNKMGKDQQFVSFKQDIRGLNVDPNTLYELIDDEEKGLVLVDVKTKQVLENILRRDPSGTCVLQGDQFNRSFCNSIINIQYAFDEVRLLNVPNTHLNNLVHYLHALDPLHLSLSSHTDCRGPDSYNGPLSDGRAGSAESYLKVTLLLMNYLEIPTNADISTVHELTRLVFDEKESVEEFLGNSLLSHYGNTEVKSNFLKYLKTARLDSLTLDRANRGKKAKNQTTIFNLIWNDLADSNSDIFRLKNEFSLNEIYNDDFNSQMEEIDGRIDAQGMGESHPVHAFSDCHLINGKNVCEMKDQAIIDLFKNMSKEDLQKKCPDLNLTSEQILKNHLENRRTDYVLKY